MKNSEQPAYPIVGSAFSDNHKGLTKREYFAAMAMQGLLSNPEWMKVYNGDKYLMQSTILSEVSIISADALLTELDKTK